MTREEFIEKKTKEIAVVLHDNFCKENHMDRCNWGYEYGWSGDVWENRVHKEWLEKARNFVEDYNNSGIMARDMFGADDIIKFIKIVAKYN